MSIFNYSLQTGIVPLYFKHAIIRPILKKSHLDPNSPSNYRPISLLPFLSKVLERLVLSRLSDHMNTLNIDEKFQSGFKNKHSTETALLYVTNELRISADNNKFSILITLDLSSAFDTLDHPTLLKILNSFLGVSDLALDWFRSYLFNRSQKVLFNNEYSEAKTLVWCTSRLC